MIWRTKDEIIRDISLRPGLNVVWSQDAVTSGVSIGHGGGKTTFCRLLRYCLGEDSFAPSAQRRATFAWTSEGRVGAEIRLDGRDWAVIRGFNAFNDWAIPNATLEQALIIIEPTGMDPFRAAATAALLGDAVQLMPKPITEASAWPAVLAWLTRDQECRFGHLLDWRHEDSDSKSPVRGRSVEDRLMIVRAVLGALRPEELVTQAERERLADEANKLRTDLGRLDWQTARWRLELARDLGFSSEQLPSELDAAAFSRAAAEKLAKATGSETEVSPADLAAAKAEQNRLETQERAADLALDRALVEMAEKTKIIKLLKDELPQLSASAATVPLCCICREPIGAIHACDTAAQKAEFERKRENYRLEEAALAVVKASEDGLRQGLALASQQRNRQRDLFNRLFEAAISRSTEVRRAQQLVVDAGRYKQLLDERQTTAGELERVEAERERLKTEMEKHRAAVQGLVRQLSSRSDAIARQLIPGEVSAWASLDGNGLRLHVNKGGDNNATAIESLKVVIFDLAVLTLCIEGHTRFPALLIHDSPREADLDLWVYHRLFMLIRSLEQYGPSPLFQYIVTTTTAPPDEIKNGEWLRLTLRGAPAAERLLKTDL